MTVGEDKHDPTGLSASSELPHRCSEEVHSRIRPGEKVVSRQSLAQNLSPCCSSMIQGSSSKRRQESSGEELECEEVVRSDIQSSRPRFNPNAPKRRKGAPPKPINSYASCLRKARLNIQRIKKEELLISAYGSNGWNGSNRDKVKPTAEVERARYQIEQSKLLVKECLQYCEDAQGHIKNPPWDLDDSGDTAYGWVACSVCQGLKSLEGNDILICDGGCRLAYHEQCLDPAVDATLIPEDDDWLCPSCSCKYEILEIINECFEVNYNSTHEIQTFLSSACTPKPSVKTAQLDAPPLISDTSVDRNKVDGEEDNDDKDDSDGCSDHGNNGCNRSSGSQSNSPKSSPSSTSSRGSEQRETQVTLDGSSHDTGDQHSSPRICSQGGKSKRRRARVDYRALNELIFGSGEQTCKDDEDEEYVP